jgi:hypothetical protein
MSRHGITAARVKAVVEINPRVPRSDDADHDLPALYPD